MVEPEQVASREDLVRFLADLADSVKRGERKVKNETVAELIEAASGWVQDMHGYFENHGLETPSTPSWSLITMIFSAALVYE